MPTALILAFLLQVGPNPSADSIANEIPRSPRAEAEAPVAPPAPVAAVPDCPLGGATDAAEIERIALQTAQLSDGRDRIAALQCVATAQAEQERWEEAAAAFLVAQDAAVGTPEWQARLGSQRAHALAAAGRIIEARDGFAQAIDNALAAGNTGLAGEIAADQAIVEVQAGDVASAGRTLATARARTPGSPRLWLLSATLARRGDDLVQAQAFIEQAAELGPFDPEIGIEAGVIAALSGRYPAAKASFESVLAMPQSGPFAQTAKTYLEQLEGMEANPQ